MLNVHAAARRLPLAWWGLFLVGCTISLVMVLHSRLGGDQGLMLQLGWQLVVNGEWLQYGMPTSAGGRSPGGLTGLFTALPLYVWQDYRAVALFTVGLHTVAFFLLIKITRPALTKHGVWLLLIFVWLNPWRLYYSAHIWNSNFMFAAAILHLLTAHKMSVQKSAVTTCLHVVLIAVALQLHTSAALLGILSLLLYWRKAIQVHWVGFAFGVAMSIALYVPWVLAVMADPTLAPGKQGFFLRGLIFVFPFVRGVLYTIKMPSLSMSSRTMEFDFTNTLGAAANDWLIPIGMMLAYLAHLSIVSSLWAHWHFVRRLWPQMTKWQHRPISAVRPRAWLQNYMALTLVAALISFAISPTTVMFWQAFIVLPVAALILIMGIEALHYTRLALWARRSVMAWAILAVLITALQSVGAPKYRCTGGGPLVDDPMLQSLRVPVSCLQTDEVRGKPES
jgi:hypothetical protein